MKELLNITSLVPNDSHKSFYGKAKIDADGNIIRLWNGWSATTGRHISAFCGLNKKEYLELPFN